MTTQKSRFKPLLWTVPSLFALVVFTIFRAGIVLHEGTSRIPLGLWPSIFAKGIFFDFWASSPLLIIGYTIHFLSTWRKRPTDRNRSQITPWILLSCFLLVLMIWISVEAVFWMEFKSRLNFIAVDYLIYTHEIIQNALQSFPLIPILLVQMSLCALLSWILIRSFSKAQDVTELSKPSVVPMLLCCIFFAGAQVRGNADWREGSGNAFADEASGNGVITFAAALHRNEIDFLKLYQTLPEQDVSRILTELKHDTSAPAQQSEKANLPSWLLRRPKNVVLVSVESLSASYLRSYGAGSNFTPEWDALAPKGLLFRRFYATGTRTVRGLEALSLGTPPSPGQSIVRRPNNDHLFSLGEILKDSNVKSFFMYGGYSYFDNMKAYFSSNSYEVFDRSDFPKETIPFENIWGVADEALYDNALIKLDETYRKDRPFFAHIMTTSNHRPYTYPNGRIDIPSPGGRGGAVKYSDYALGRFVRDAEKHPWFEDTLFILTADHCASVAGKTRLPVRDFHIPLLFYGPKLIRPGFVDDLLSQIDLPPTIAALFNHPLSPAFFGQSLITSHPLAHRAFIGNYQELGYLKSQTLTVLRPKKVVESYQVSPNSEDQTPSANNDPVLVQEAIGYYQASSEAFRRGRLKMESVEKRIPLF